VQVVKQFGHNCTALLLSICLNLPFCVFIKPIPDSKACACMHKLGAAYLKDLLLAKSLMTSTDSVTAESA